MMTDFNIRRGLSSVLFSEPGVVNPQLILEEGCWYLCTDTAELYLGVQTDDRLTLKKINGHNAADDPTHSPDDEGGGEADRGLIGAYIDEAGELWVLFSDNTEESLGVVVGQNGVDGLTTAIKIDDTVYTHTNGVIELPSFVTEETLDAKGFITEHQSLEGKADVDHKHDDRYDAKGAAEAVKNDLLNGAGAAYDTLKELGNLIDENQDAIEALETIAVGKADKVHSHPEYLTEHQSLEDYAKLADLPSVDGLASESYVDEKVAALEIPETEIYKIDFNAPDYTKAVEAYNNGKVLVLINAAPDINSYAVMNYVSENYITFTKFLTSRSEAYGVFNTYYLSQANTWEISKEVKLNKVEANVDGDVVGNLASIRIGKEIYSLPSTDGLATKDEIKELASTSYVDEKVAAIEVPEVPTKISELENDARYATEQFVKDEIAKIEPPEVDTSKFVTNEVLSVALTAKANEIPFITAKFVTKSLGNFSTGDDINGMTIAEIFAKLLGLSDTKPTEPEVPTIPETKEEIIDEILRTAAHSYVLGESGDLVAVDYVEKALEATEAKKTYSEESFFYTVVDDGDNLVSAGYQINTPYQENDYLTVAIPDYITAFHVETYDGDSETWVQPNWVLEKSSGQAPEGYTRYTVPEEYVVLSGIVIRVVIDNKD